MNSKELIEGSRIDEADKRPPPPGITTPGGAPEPHRHPPRERGARPPGLPRRGPQAGGAGGAENNESKLLKDALLLISTAGQPDFELAKKLMAGVKAGPGEIQHILDEAQRIYDDLPTELQTGLGAIYRRLQGGGGEEEAAPTAEPPSEGAGGDLP